MDARELDRRFDHHPPDDARGRRHAEVREGVKTLARLLDLLLPDGREKLLAITNLEQTAMWANAAVAREE